MNIKTAIIDNDVNYLERLSGVMQQYDELSISVFSRIDSFQQAMDLNDFQIVLFNPDISGRPLQFSPKTMPICLCSEETTNKKIYPGVLAIQKFQRISNIYKEIIKNYAEYASDFGMEYFKGGNTKVIAVHSPVGGCGKTTVALAIARKVQALNKRVLFLSVEQCNSSSLYCTIQEEGITQLVESVNGGSNFELKLKGIMKQNNEGIFYIEGFNRLVDYDDVSHEELEDIIKKIKLCNGCDYIIVDTGSTLDAVNKTVLENSDKIVLVQRGGELADIKTEMFDKQVMINELKNRMCVIKNFATQNMRGYEMADVPVIGVIHNYGNIAHSDLLNSIGHENGINVNAILA